MPSVNGVQYPTHRGPLSQGGSNLAGGIGRGFEVGYGIGEVIKQRKQQKAEEKRQKEVQSGLRTIYSRAAKNGEFTTQDFDEAFFLGGREVAEQAKAHFKSRDGIEQENLLSYGQEQMETNNRMASIFVSAGQLPPENRAQFFSGHLEILMDSRDPRDQVAAATIANMVNTFQQGGVGLEQMLSDDYIKALETRFKSADDLAKVTTAIDERKHDLALEGMKQEGQTERKELEIEGRAAEGDADRALRAGLAEAERAHDAEQNELDRASRERIEQAKLPASQGGANGLSASNLVNKYGMNDALASIIADGKIDQFMWEDEQGYQRFGPRPGVEWPESAWGTYGLGQEELDQRNRRANRAPMPGTSEFQQNLRRRAAGASPPSTPRVPMMGSRG